MTKEFGICGEIVGASPFIMPATSAQGANIAMKSSESTSELSNSVNFWARIDDSHTVLGYESVSLTTATDTTEQTIIDLSSQGGVLTNVLCPELSASGTVTVRITIDGTLTTLVSPTLALSTNRFCVGAFIPRTPTDAILNGMGDGSAFDPGYEVATPSLLMLNPLQALKHKFGMPYKDSCKVTIQGSVAPEAGDTGKAAACHTTTALIGA